MKIVILVMRARQIKESLRSIRAIPYAKVWVEYHWESEIMEEFPGIVQEAKLRGFTHLSIVSDDGIIDEVENAILILKAAADFPVVCGWCYDSRYKDKFPRALSNMSKSPLRGDSPRGGGRSYDLYTVADLLTYPDPEFPTWFSGMTFHTMSLEMWEKYPFQCFVGPKGRGWSSDFHICKRLQNDNVSIVGLRDGMIRHLGRRLSNPAERELYCGGLRPKNIRWET